MNPTLNSPKYAAPESLDYRLHKIQQERKNRKKFVPQLEQRYFRRNEGTTDGYETNARLIPDPLTHFDVEFQLLGTIDPDGTFLSQSISAGSSSREFQLFQNSSALVVVLGGESNGTTTTLTTGLWRVKFDGVNIEILKDGVGVETIAATLGASLEPSATFTMCTRHNGDNSSYGFHYAGVMADVKIRNSYGVITHDYPLNDNSSTIRDKANGQNGTIINGNAADWGLFDRQADGDWLGQELWGLPNTAATWSNFSSAATDIPDGVLITSLDGNYDRGEAIVDNPPLHVGSNYKVSILARRGAQGVAQHIDQFTFMSIPPTPITSSVMTKYEFNGICTNSTGVMRVYANTDGLIGDEVVIGGASVKEVLKNA